MSHVSLLAADRPMPLREATELRHRVVHIPAEHREAVKRSSISVAEPGFSVQEHSYYRRAVEALELTVKPCQYELDLRDTPEDAHALRAYLEENCVPGETVELWDLWVGSWDEPLKVRRFRGRLAEFDTDTLKQLQGHIGEQQTCIIIEI